MLRDISNSKRTHFDKILKEIVNSQLFLLLLIEKQTFNVLKLGKKLDASYVNFYGQISKLYKLKLISKERKDGNCREKIYKLTDKGKELIKYFVRQ